MKKLIGFFALFFLLLCMTACNNNDDHTDLGNSMKFTSSEEMLKYMDGMWVTEDNADAKSYYIFQNGQVYVMTDAMYCAQVTKILDSTLQNGGLDALYVQDFENISNRMHLNDISTKPDPVTLFPEDGIIKLYDGKYDEESIVITEDAVLLVAKDTENTAVITKLSNTADFSHNDFSSLFDAVKKNYTSVPASWLFPSAGEYAEVIKEFYPDIEYFVLVNKTNDSATYTSDGKTKDSYSTFFVSNDSVIYSRDKLVITYTPGSSSYDLLVMDKKYPNLAQLLQYVEPVLNCFPGTLSTSEIVERFENEHTVSSGWRTLVITTDGITCTINQTTDNKEMLIRIEVANSIQLPEEFEIKEDATITETTPMQSGTLEQLLDGSKCWVGKWKFEGWEYNVYYVFKEDGNCYFALGSNTYLFGAGMGTYTVADGNIISVDLMMNGKKCPATYIFDPNTFSLEVVSVEGFAAQKGDTFSLQEDMDHDVETVENWGESHSQETIDDEDWD